MNCVKKTARWLTVPLLAVLAMSPRGHAQTSLPVVPGGAGYGMTTRAAYGGGVAPVILRVTNLNDAGAGSFRAAIEATMPRVIIFEISGTILLNSDIYVTNPYVTVAGATAPSPGITLRRYGMTIMTHDVLVQHLRVRVGDQGPTVPTNAGYDGLIAYGGNAYNIVVDHCSISWAGGESSGTVSPPPTSNITYARNIISEALHFSKAVDEDSHGMIIYGGTKNFAAIGNLFAHNVERNPEAQEDTRFLFVNNVVYDWGHTDEINYYPMALLLYNGGRVQGPFLSSVVGNKFIKGPTTPSPRIAAATYSGFAGSQIYFADTTVDGSVTPFVNFMGFDPTVNTPPVPLTGIDVRPSSNVEALVLANAGARPNDRDAVDTRIVYQVQTRTGSYIKSQDQVGGWPTLAVNSRTLSLPASPHSVRSSGYTALEEWLHGFAAQVEGSGSNTSTSTGKPAPPTGLRIVY